MQTEGARARVWFMQKQIPFDWFKLRQLSWSSQISIEKLQMDMLLPG